MTRPYLLACLILGGLLAACQPRPEPAASAPVPTPAPTPAREPEARLPEGPGMAPQPVPLDERPCLETLGEAASARLVQRCIAVSPATRPPCHASNPCNLIQSEIDRSCAMWTRDGETPPKECKG
ncbi:MULTISPECIES: hypothetical protein [Brevundimonas]|uniref:hypothetical protein n=1 Tax=Brevundimonas sp. 357 TaxID=2555782 RepID=UPI000F7694B9|nr:MULTISPECIES: hypothetical protein [Brevundimonas]RSB48125.1 hypothetical protein EGK63_01330 [Brevundimonas sp. 357]